MARAACHVRGPVSARAHADQKPCARGWGAEAQLAACPSIHACTSFLQPHASLRSRASCRSPAPPRWCENPERGRRSIQRASGISASYIAAATTDDAALLDRVCVYVERCRLVDIFNFGRASVAGSTVYEYGRDCSKQATGGHGCIHRVTAISGRSGRALISTAVCLCRPTTKLAARFNTRARILLRYYILVPGGH
jgi:hypothetical protein